MLFLFTVLLVDIPQKYTVYNVMPKSIKFHFTEYFLCVLLLLAAAARLFQQL